jgi:hypothetical protein
MDFTMPGDLRLERQAFTRATGFAHIAKVQDKLAKDDDVQRARNKAAFQARTRELLDGQMRELAAKKVRTAPESGTAFMLELASNLFYVREETWGLASMWQWSE